MKKKDVLQILSLIIIAISIFMAIKYMYIYKQNFFTEKSKKEISTTNNPDAIKYSSKLLNVTMDVVPETIDENNTKFKITTNLPNNTKIGIKVSNDELNYNKQTMATVLSGQVETDSFNSNNFSLPNGDYSIEIVTPIESTQDYNSVRALFGKNGCNLQGDYISDSKNGQDKIVKFTKDISITDSLTSKFEAEPDPKIGMTKDELLGSNWGKPQSINKTTTVNGTEEQWCYNGFRYIYLDNGVVTTIQDH